MIGSLSNYTNLYSFFQNNDKFSDKLSSQDRIKLGTQVLEKFGEAQFHLYQKKYRLTKSERQEIFNSASDYKKDLVTWEQLEESSYREDVDLIKNQFPEAKFFVLITREENERYHPIVEMEGKRYYFYSHVYKGPKVSDSYISEYKACQKAEHRPNFQTIPGENRTVFLMEFMGEKSPDFREESHLRLIIQLIVQKSLTKKGLDMLPSRLAIKEQQIFCVDPKLKYTTYESEMEAYQDNIKMLKSKIVYHGYGEESYLLNYVDEVAAEYETSFFEKILETLPFFYKIFEKFPPDTLNSVQKVHLTTAVLKRFGTRELSYCAKNYKLSIEDQKEALKSAGKELIENRVEWNKDITSGFEELHKKSQKVLKDNNLEGSFSCYLNRVGNYKDVLTVSINGTIYVVYEVNKEYIEKFQSQKEREHRPDFLALPLDQEKFIFFSKFMGSQTIDYSNYNHLDMIFDLAWNFSGDSKSTIDFNYGNLLIKDEKVFYIDKDLTHTLSDNPQMTNLKEIFQSIKENLHLKHEKMKSEIYIKNKIKTLANPENPQHLGILKLFFPEEFKPNLSPRNGSDSNSFPLEARKNKGGFKDNQKKITAITHFSEFLETIDLDNAEDRINIVSYFKDFFYISRNKLTKNEYLVLFGEYYLKSEYAKEGGVAYFNLMSQIIELLMNKL